MTDDSAEAFFRNVISCEDIREEVGNKKSLLGVFSGDLIPDELPANVQIAFYVELVTGIPTQDHTVALRLEIERTTVFSATIEIRGDPQLKVATIILPRGVLRMEKEGRIALFGKIDETAEQEIFSTLVLRPNNSGTAN